MALSENKQILIDAIMLGDMQLSEDANIAHMIESDYITESDAEALLEAVETLSAKEAKAILRETYAKYRSEDFQMLTEEEFADRRNSALLLEADNDDSGAFMSPQVKAMLLGSTVPQLLWMYAILNPDQKEEFKRTLKSLASGAGKKYDNIQDFFKLLPKREGGLKFRFDKEALPSLKKADDGSRLKNLVATRKDGNWHGNISKIAITTLMTILITSGITALVIHLKKYYSAAEKNIRQICGRYPQNTKDYRKCELTLRVKYCDEIINKLSQAMPACKQKNNPYKCMNSIQKNIYIWKIRRKDYETRLKRIID